MVQRKSNLPSEATNEVEAVAETPKVGRTVRKSAKDRAAEIRNARGGMDMEEIDRYKIDLTNVPSDWSYEWKRKTLLGKEDPSYEVNLARGGWEPVPVERHPEMMPAGYKGHTIELDGMMLMERPRELTDEAKDIEKRRARAQVIAKEAQLYDTPDGTLPRDADARVKPRISKSMERMSIPKE
jgi:hypothetical protein